MSNDNDTPLQAVFRSAQRLAKDARGVYGAQTVVTQAPSINVQWKNMSVCLDFQCTCSAPDDAYEFHLDADYLYSRCVRCPRCGAIWRLLDPTIERVEATDPDWDWVQEAPLLEAEFG